MSNCSSELLPVLSWVQMGSDGFRWVQTSSDEFRRVQMGSDEDLGEGEGCLVGEEKVGKETDSSCPAFKQAQRVVGSPR